MNQLADSFSLLEFFIFSGNANQGRFSEWKHGKNGKNDRLYVSFGSYSQIRLTSEQVKRPFVSSDSPVPLTVIAKML